MTEPQIMAIFPEPVARYRIWARTWQAGLGAEPMELRTNHSYSRDSRVLDRWPQLKQQIQQSVNQFSQTVMAFAAQPLITQSWLNQYTLEQTIHQHNHPNSVISGVWFWQLAEEAEILFHRSAVNTTNLWTMKFDRDPSRSTAWSVDTMSVRVTEGDLLLWPSYLQHSVPPWQGEGTRCSLSFNSLPERWGSDLYQSR